MSHSTFCQRSTAVLHVCCCARSTGAASGTAGHAAAQVLPYFYIPYDEDLPLDADGARAWLRDLARGIDHAMQIGASVGSSRMLTAMQGHVS
jgi:hypothetical protein